MFQRIINYSVRNKLLVFLMVGVIVLGGFYSMRDIPLDAVPDITNNQVQVVTVSPTLAAEEIEQLITFPIEASLANIPGVVEIRSISRYGLSVITVVFEEEAPILDNRQYVREQLLTVEIPPGLGTPELMPITTGLGEIYQYTLQVSPEYAHRYDIMELRTIQDWIVKRQLAGISGVIEVSSFGGYVKQYEVSVDAERLFALQLTIPQVIEALERNNENSGASYIEEGTGALYIRTFGRLLSKEDIENVLISRKGHLPVYVRDVAVVKFGAPNRYGAMTMDGKGEVVGGITLMLKGSSSSGTIANVKQRIEQISSALPQGVAIVPYLDRSELINRAIDTVQKNLIEGGLIVIFVLILLLGNWRGGLIVASVIPLSMLFAFIMMRYFGVSANLMSLGAIDFGIVVDGAVIIVEAVLHALYTRYIGKKLSQSEMDSVISETSGKIYNSAAFGILIILVVFVPIMTLTGIEGKMFRPMAYTVSFAILGAMILSLTYVPVMATILLKKEIEAHETFADKIIHALRSAYKPTIEWALTYPKLLLSAALVVLLVAVFTFSRMGGEFIPTLEEGDLAMQMTIQPGSALSESIKTSTKAEKILMENFPEVKHVVSKIGTGEVPTDPMAIEDADIMIILKEKDEWVTTDSREDLVTKMKEKLEVIIGASFEFTQPIQLRFNELMTGAKTDIAIQIFGEDTRRLAALANKTAGLIADIPGVGDIKVEQTEGLPQLKITYDRALLAHYGIPVTEVNTIIKAAYAGAPVGQIFENERQFDLVVRYDSQFREHFDPDKLWASTGSGHLIPVSKLTQMEFQESPLQISREQAKRRINVGVNVRNRDVASLVSEIERRIESQLRLPPGYLVTYGGQFENMEKAQARLKIAVPLALISILLLLYFTFGNIMDSLIIFIAVPLSAIGGVFALWIRDMPFSISAGVGFIALFGVAVLNGIVLIQYYKQLRQEGETSVKNLVIQGGIVRLRPVIMTAAVAALGFLPMAISTTAGAEVQRPLATVVIGGLITSTLLTLVILPILYSLVYGRKGNLNSKGLMLFVLLTGLSVSSFAQGGTSLSTVQTKALGYYPTARMATLDVKRQEVLKKQNYDPGNLNANLSYGQINASVNDYNFSVNQALGNIPKAIASNKSSALAINLARLDERLTQKWIKREVSEVYLDWVLSGLIFNALQDQAALYEDVLEKGVRSVQSGNKSSLDVVLLRQEYQSIKNQEAYAKLDYAFYRNRLVELTGLQTDSLLLPAAFPELSFAGDTVLSSLFYKILDQRSDLGHQRLTTEKLGFFPNFSIGYFNQQLEGASGFQGFQVGASLPLWFQPQKARVQERKIDLDMVMLENELKLKNLQQSLEKCLQSNELIMETLQSHQNTDVREITEQAKRALDLGQIDFFDFSRLVGQSYEGQRSVWKTRHLFLKNLTELNYYTE